MAKILWLQGLILSGAVATAVALAYATFLMFRQRQFRLRLDRGIELNRQGSYHLAIQSISSALEIQDTDPTAYYNLGFALLRGYREPAYLERANRLLKRAVHIDPGYAEAYLALGYLALHGLGRPDQALPFLTRAVELSPSLTDGYNTRGLARMKTGDLDGARADFAKALIEDPGRADVRANLGILHFASGDTAGGLGDLQEAAKLAPADPKIQANLGNALAIEGRFDEASQVFEDLCHKVPGVANYQYWHGAVALAQQNFTAARDAFIRATGLEPASARAHMGLAQVYQSLGKSDRAAAEMETALALDPALGAGLSDL